MDKPFIWWRMAPQSMTSTVGLDLRIFVSETHLSIILVFMPTYVSLLPFLVASTIIPFLRIGETVAESRSHNLGGVPIDATICI